MIIPISKNETKLPNALIDVQQKLADLRSRVFLTTPIYTERPLLTPVRRFFARIGIIKIPAAGDLGLFASSGLILILGFSLLAGISSGISTAKHILGETAVGFEFLRGRDLEAARLQFAKIEADIRSANFGNFADRIPAVSKHLIAAMEILENQGGKLSDINLSWDQSANASSPEFYYRLADARYAMAKAKAELLEAEILLADLPTSLLPSELRTDFKTGFDLMVNVRKTLDKTVDLSGVILSLLEGREKTYMLIFQNNNEARATGGFIGTYGLATIGNGRVKINKIESIYEPDGQLKEQIAAPGPLQRQATTAWGMRDSNWFADFPSSSRKILEFLEKESGVLAEGVISFTPDVFEDLLSISGPVDMPEYGVTLTAENFRDTAQRKTSLEYDRQLNQPKKFLADFAPRIMARLGELDEQGLLRLLEILSRAASEKQFMIFSLDGAVQNKLQDYGLTGEIKSSADDYLAIIHSNVGGGKTDLAMSQTVDKSVKIDEFGRRISTLRITRTNNETDELYFPRNIDFMRVFVPAGSKLISATGFDADELLSSSIPGMNTDADMGAWDAAIQKHWQSSAYVGKEAGHTVFMGWLAVDPTQTKTVELVYELPKAGNDYSLLVQKQAGSAGFTFNLEVSAQGREIIYQHPENFEGNKISADSFYAVIAR